VRAEIIDHVRTDTFITTDYTPAAAELPLNTAAEPLVIEESKSSEV
jgi:hypothetical protein